MYKESFAMFSATDAMNHWKRHHFILVIAQNSGPVSIDTGIDHLAANRTFALFHS